MVWLVGCILTILFNKKLGELKGLTLTKRRGESKFLFLVWVPPPAKSERGIKRVLMGQVPIDVLTIFAGKLIRCMILDLVRQ